MLALIVDFPEPVAPTTLRSSHQKAIRTKKLLGDLRYEDVCHVDGRLKSRCETARAQAI